jgi:hypothetical protein
LAAPGRVARERVSPRLGVPTVAIQPHRQMQLGHEQSSRAAPSRIVVITHCAALWAAMHSKAGLCSARVILRRAQDSGTRR